MSRAAHTPYLQWDRGIATAADHKRSYCKAAELPLPCRAVSQTVPTTSYTASNTQQKLPAFQFRNIIF